jgi:hypothetical protein
MWQGAKETAEFCRFWRFLASVSCDWEEVYVTIAGHSKRDPRTS